MNVKVLLVLLLSGAVFSSSPRLHATERLRVHASPASSSDITVYVGIDRHADNRMLRVTAASSDFFRGSEIQLDGEASPRVSVFRFAQVPSGWYEVTVQLFTDNRRAAETARCSVFVA